MSYSYALSTRPLGQPEFTVIASGMADTQDDAVVGVMAAFMAHSPSAGHAFAEAQLAHVMDTHKLPAAQRVTLVVPARGRSEVEADITLLTKMAPR